MDRTNTMVVTFIVHQLESRVQHVRRCAEKWIFCQARHETDALSNDQLVELISQPRMGQNQSHNDAPCLPLAHKALVYFSATRTVQGEKRLFSNTAKERRQTNKRARVFFSIQSTTAIRSGLAKTANNYTPSSCGCI